MSTWRNRVKGLPCGLWWRYSEPARRMRREKRDSDEDTEVDGEEEPIEERVLLTGLPGSPSSNLSVPKEEMQGLMPPVPRAMV
ncbi:hypothetical protein HPP92_027268 [Vanilla planifolia]|uniref:Uncharacterized protein n=1 Tax=Vanilla planifolia TaxID=51239 RepID=A0A835PAH4_VANPL|nr:hypothetical protein HPP92_027268 [Vanilla planifolia]